MNNSKRHRLTLLKRLIKKNIRYLKSSHLFIKKTIIKWHIYSLAYKFIILNNSFEMQVQQLRRRLNILSVLGVGLLVCQQFNKYLCARKRIQQLKKEPIHTITDQKSYKKLQGLGKKIALIKLTVIESNQLKCQRKVGSIQYFYDVFPIERNILKVMDGQKQRNMFIINHKYKQTERGFFGSIFFGFGSALAFVIDIIIGATTFSEKPIFIGGPQIGILETTIRLVTDRPLIFQLELVNGELVPKFFGLTKDNILQKCSQEKHRHLIFSCICAIYLFCNRHLIKRSFIKPIKDFFQQIITRFKVFSKQKKKGDFFDANVDNQLLCIICMNRCRNVIFDNCKHLIICNSCKKEYEGEQIDKCPLCRKETEQRYIFVKEQVQEDN